MPCSCLWCTTGLNSRRHGFHEPCYKWARKCWSELAQNWNIFGTSSYWARVKQFKITSGGASLYCMPFISIFRRFQNCENWLLGLSCHVCLSVCPFAWKNTAVTGRIFMKFDIWTFFRKPVAKIQVSLKSDKNGEYFTRKNSYIYDNSSLNSC